MKPSKKFFLVAALVLMAGTAVLLNWCRTHQKLGVPGIKATPIPGDITMQFDLPASVLDYKSEAVPQDSTVLALLPKDTSYAQRRYKGRMGSA